MYNMVNSDKTREIWSALMSQWEIKMYLTFIRYVYISDFNFSNFWKELEKLDLSKNNFAWEPYILLNTSVCFYHMYIVKWLHLLKYML